MFRLHFNRMILLSALSVILGVSAGCARYARNVNTLYEPAATARGGSGVLYIVMPAGRETLPSNVKWVIGTVKDHDGMEIDKIFSPRSPLDIVQSALSLELRKAGYTVQTVTAKPAGPVREIDLTNAGIVLDQVSSLADLKATCHMDVQLDAGKNGQLIKKLHYESTYSNTTVKDRDLLAGTVLQEALHSLMEKAVPEIVRVFEK